mgnify:CR=1 FL=1
MEFHQFFKTLKAVRKEVLSNSYHFASEAGMGINTIQKIEKGNQPQCSAC